MSVDWPPRWQPEARAELAPLIGTDVRVRVVVGDPATSIDGSVVEGFLSLDGSRPMIVFDRSDAADVYPWALPAGPVLRIFRVERRRRPVVLFAHEGWSPRRGR